MRKRIKLVALSLCTLFLSGCGSKGQEKVGKSNDGTVTLSYKVNNNTYKQKTTVRKYVNPLSTLKIGSLSLASKFKKDSTYTLSYEKYKNKELKLQVKTKSGWELSGVRYITSPKTSNSMGTWISNGGTFKVSQKNCSLTVYVFDPKTKQSEECLIIFK